MQCSLYYNAQLFQFKLYLAKNKIMKTFKYAYLAYCVNVYNYVFFFRFVFILFLIIDLMCLYFVLSL